MTSADRRWSGSFFLVSRTSANSVNSTRTRLIADNDAINVAVLATGVINHARELGVEVDTVVRARVGSRQFDVLLRVVRERLR